MSELVRLGEVCHTTSGGTPSRAKRDFFGGSIPWVKSGNLNDGIVREVDEYLTVAGLESSSAKVFPCGTLLIAMYGATVGKLGILGIDAATNQAVCGIQPDMRLDRDFLFYFLLHKRTALVAKSIGGAQPNISQAIIRDTLLPLPPLEEQRRIVSLLDRAANIRRRADIARAHARAIIPALFLDIFGDPATNPKKWRPLTLGDALLSGPQNGLYRPTSDYGDGTRILRIDSFDDGSMRDQRLLKRLRIDTASIEKFALREDDIVINRVNSPPQLGKSVLVPKLEEPTVFESNMMRIEINAEILTPAVLGTMLQLDSVRKALVRNAKHAINQSSINQGDVKGVAIFAPPLPLQSTFAEQARHIQATASTLDATATKTEAMAAALSAECFG